MSRKKIRTAADSSMEQLSEEPENREAASPGQCQQRVWTSVRAHKLRQVERPVIERQRGQQEEAVAHALRRREAERVREGAREQREVRERHARPARRRVLELLEHRLQQRLRLQARERPRAEHYSAANLQHQRFPLTNECPFTHFSTCMLCIRERLCSVLLCTDMLHAL